MAADEVSVKSGATVSTLIGRSTTASLCAESPAYRASMVCAPAVSAELVKLAVPLLAVAVPRDVPSDRKVTVPPGTLALTVDVRAAVSVMLSPTTSCDGLADSASFTPPELIKSPDPKLPVLIRSGLPSRFTSLVKT